MADNNSTPSTDYEGEVKIRHADGREYGVSEAAFTDLYEPDGFEIVADMVDGAYVYRNPEDDPTYVAPTADANAPADGQATVPAAPIADNTPVTTMGDGRVIPVIMPDGTPAPEA